MPPGLRGGKLTNSRIWNPFSNKVKVEMERVKEEKFMAHEIQQQTQERKARHEAIYQEQKSLSDALRKEQRKNHFSDLFQTAVPLRPQATDERK